MARIALLSAGGYLVAGCLSGRKHEDDHPPIEHYILLFAVADNMFLFWDPDVSVTNIAELTSKIGPAVGVMIYDNTDSTRPKLSTGLNFSDLSDIDINGHHTNHRKRHRYQVMTLAKP